MTTDPLRDLILGATEPSAEASARLHGAVARQAGALREVDRLARRIGEPSSDTIQHLHMRIDSESPRRARWPWVLAVGGACAAAAVGLLSLRTSSDPLQHVHLELDGVGHIEQESAEPVVVWQDGHLDAEVDPNQGVHLAVRTPEATVTVVGTGFTVDRADFATRVDVRHGIVSVSCADGTERRLLEGQSATCLPTDPATLLRRVVALGPTGRADDRRRAIDAGLAGDGEPAIRAELLARRVELLAPTDEAGALVAAEDYLRLGVGGRRRAMLAFVATHRYASEGCGAVDALRAAVQEDPTSSLAEALAECTR